MRQGQVYCNGIVAGVITEDENGYTFEYDKAYLARNDAQAISLTFLEDKPARSYGVAADMLS